eukprot:s172_g21.t1
MPFQLQPGSTSLDLESEDSEEENDTPPKKARKTLKEDEEDAKPGSPGEENLGSPKATAHRAKANADKVLARWCAICPDKSAQGCELSCANLGGSTGSRVRLRCGMVLLLQGEVPPMTTHEAVASASAFLRQNDPVRAARALNHAAPLTVAAMVHEHIKLATQEANAERTGASPSKRAMVVDGAESDSQALTQRDRQRLALSRCSPLPVPFRVAFAPPELHELQGCDFKDGVAFAAHPRCKEHRVSAILGDCHLVSGGFMSAVQAAADNTSRAPDCIVEFDMDPFAVRFVPFPPTDETKIYSKVHAICPDGQHRAILLSLPCGCKPAAESGESGELLARSSQPPSQQLSFKCSLLRRSIERGRLFGGGRKAVEEAFTAILDSPEPFATASALRCLTLVSMEAVRLWKGRAEHVSFGSLAMLAILASSVPSWRPPLALREALLRTVAAVQAADQPDFFGGCSSGAMAETKELKILQPDDFHHHFRDEPFLEHTVPHAAAAFCRVLVMPNLVPPVTTTQAALAYRERILLRLPKTIKEGEFVPLMTLYLTDNMTPEEITKAKTSGHIYAVKLYPAGATTNSDFGVTDYERIIPALKKMEELGILLLVHGESTDQSVDIFDREADFYDKVMPMNLGCGVTAVILARCPNLRVVCEHITTAAVASFVEKAGPNVAATITAHHLCHNRNAIFKGGINPHYYCLPILKTEQDRLKLLQCAVENSKFFLGTDSAPHTVGKKECACGCAGCFTAHMSIEMVAEAFEPWSSESFAT